MAVDRIVVVAPIVPACTGNGLAMRAGMFLEALSGHAEVDLVVVPVSGATADLGWSTSRAHTVNLVEPVTGAAAVEHVTAQLADRRLRARLEAAAPLPARARLAPPTLVDDVLAVLDREPAPAVVVALRGYLAPLGAELAARTGAPRFVIDLDDDDEPLLRELGEQAEADAFHRLGRAWLPDADAVLVASSLEAPAVRDRYGLDTVIVVPNAVHPIPSLETPGPGETTGRGAHLLFVGNLTYGPNLEAATLLVEAVLPLVRHRWPDAVVDLVGAAGPGALDQLAARPGVTIAGHVPDVAPWYARAGVVVVPLRHGAGTRFKVLEAFAHRRPVVATPAAVAGLEVTHGRDVLVSETPVGLGRAVTDLLEDPGLGAAIVDRAERTLEAHYVPAAVYPALGQAVLGPLAPSGPAVRSTGGTEAA